MNPQLQHILMREAIIVQQEVELTNVLIGVDMGNRYAIYGTNGEKLGLAAEVQGGVGGFLLRQIFNNARACTVQIYDPQGQEIGQARKPFKFIYSEMGAFDGDNEIGRTRRRTWIARNYTISVNSDPLNPFAISSPLWQWKNIKFDITRNGVVVATIMKKFEGFLKMAFTQADNFSIQFHDEYLTLEERYTLFATLFLIDYDVFEQN